MNPNMINSKEETKINWNDQRNESILSPLLNTQTIYSQFMEDSLKLEDMSKLSKE